MKVDYEKRAQEQQVLNIKDMISNLSSKGMQIKIINFSEKYGLDKNYVEQKIVDDPTFAVNFAIDPGRQSIHESVAFEYISSMKNIKSATNLPIAGPKALYICKTGVVSGKEGKSKSKAKSIDFLIETENKEIFITHKYTKDDGGSQDNQFNDVKMFIEEVKNMTNKDGKIFIALLDGPYYQRSNRMNILKSLSDGCVEIMTIEDLEYFIEKQS